MFLKDAMEDPIQAAAAAGFVDMSSTNPAFPRVSSYVFKVRTRRGVGRIKIDRDRPKTRGMDVWV